MENNQTANGGPTPRNGTAPPVAQVPAPGQTGNAPAPVHARQSVPKFGGNPTGRATKFRFPADTPDGIEERRKADADRKAASRAVASQLVEPPPLPAALSRMPADSVATSGNGESAGPVVAVAEVVVPWTPADIREFTDELVDLSEAKRVSDFVAVAKEAKLPESLVRELQTDAKYPVKSKNGLKVAIAAVAAKWLNRTGISSKNKEEAALIFFGWGIWLQGQRLRAKLDELIREDKEQRKKAEEARAVMPA